MPHAIKGAVIERAKGDTIVYRQKCDSCGTVGGSSINATVAKNVTLSGSFFCAKCRKFQKIEIKGDPFH